MSESFKNSVRMDYLWLTNPQFFMWGKYTALCTNGATGTPYRSHRQWWSSWNCSTFSRSLQSRCGLVSRVWSRTLCDCHRRGQKYPNGILEWHVRSFGYSVAHIFNPTNDDCTHSRLIKNPSCGNVCDAQLAMPITDPSQDDKQGLKKLPIPPSIFDHVKIL